LFSSLLSHFSNFNNYLVEDISTVNEKIECFLIANLQSYKNNWDLNMYKSKMLFFFINRKKMYTADAHSEKLGANVETWITVHLTKKWWFDFSTNIHHRDMRRRAAPPPPTIFRVMWLAAAADNFFGVRRRRRRRMFFGEAT